MKAQKPILVTGSHRSGSTWVGKMLAKSSSVGYIFEPFNLKHRPGICKAKFDYWFPYITYENESSFYQAVKDTLSFKYNLAEEIKAVDSIIDGLRLIRDYSSFFKNRFYQLRPLIKDPIAFFSAEWLAEKFDMDVVILIRHPAAFVGSLKEKDWYFDFSHFLNQPLLMRDYLSKFESEISRCSQENCDIVEQGILLWKIFYSTVLEYQNKHKNWIFIKHEDISANPVVEFETLFDKLNLEFLESIKQQITEYSSQAIKNELLKNASLPLIWSEVETRRNSIANIYSWKKRLASAEIEKIRTEVEDISSLFYSDEDW
jgi:hypothetical protein